jgi:hypothetical protein
MARPLNGDGHRPLMFRAGTELAARFDLPTFRQVPPKARDVLVVDILDVVDAKRADFAAWHEPPAAATAPATWPVPAVAISATAGREPRTALAALRSR